MSDDRAAASAPLTSDNPRQDFADRCAADLPLIRARVTELKMALQRAGGLDAARVLMRYVDDPLNDLETAAAEVAPESVPCW